MLIAFSSNSQTTIEVCGNIVQDTTWSEDTVRIFNNVIIDENSTLTVSAGSYIEFQGHYSIIVNGNINAVGTELDSIYFTINDSIGFSDTTIYSGGWGSIQLLGDNLDSSVFSYCDFKYGKAIKPGVKPVNIKENQGGAIYVDGMRVIVVTNSHFSNNIANNSGGAMYLKGCSSVEIRDNSFDNNKVYYEGGAVFIMSSQNCRVNNNSFIGNYAIHSDSSNLGDGYVGIGGAITTYSNCTINGNIITNNKSVSGSIYESTNNSYIIDNIITNNSGTALMNGHGNGMSVYENNVIANNLSILPGSGIQVNSSKLNIINNIIWGNSNEYFPQFSEQIDIPAQDSAFINYNCVQDGFPGEGNISTNPQFANPTEGAGIEYDGLSADWTLLETSPCINTGTPDTTGLNLPEFDIAGNPRVFGGRIDMGAYENQSVYVKINESPVYSKINLYPNPGNNEIFIDIPPEINGSWIDIVNGQGKVLMHEQINISPAMLSPYKLKSGIYFYRIYNENKVIKSGKWVKNGR